MKIEKIHLDEMYRAYCASSIEINGELNLLVASEEKGRNCYMYYGKDFSKRELVWDNVGGCMSIIPIPNKEGEFIAVQEFYLKETPSTAKLVWGKYTEDGWQIKDLISLPYVHRFDIYRQDGVTYLIAATIAESKKHKEDWSKAGKIYVGVLDDPEKGIDLKVLKDGMFRNHGYSRNVEDGHQVGYFTSDQGIIRVTPPLTKDGEWRVEDVIDGKFSEIALIDIDYDGELEMMTIEPFHGDTIKIYKKIDGEYKAVYEYEPEIDFAHTLVAGTLAGKNTFIAGVRRVDAELFYVQFEDGKFITKIIESGVGPANIQLVNQDGYDLIVAANHTDNKAAVYRVEKE